MPSGLELLGGILNIVQVIGVISLHVQGFRRLEGILKEAESRAKRIESNIRRLDPLFALDGVQAQILDEAVQDFQKINEELNIIHEKLDNRSTARNFLNSPQIVEQLIGIHARLATRDDIIKLVTMIGSLNVELRTKCAKIIALLSELNSKTLDIASVQKMLEKICQMKMIEDSVQEITQRRKGYRTDHMSGYVHLSAGVNLYNGAYGLKSYEEAAQHFHAAVRLGWKQAYYYLGMQDKYGKGVDRCNTSAKNFFQLGADAGDIQAVTRLGDCYDEGIGVERDPQMAYKLVKQGAEGSDRYGMAVYAWYNLHGHNTDVNFSVAFKMSKKAAEHGFGKDVLATCYEYGINVERNPKKAAELYFEAANPKAYLPYLCVAKCYEQGIGVDVDLAEAAAVYRNGSNFVAWRRPTFQAYYGLCLVRGRGISKDAKKGWAEIRKSIQGNNAIGWYVRGECYRYGYGVEPDLIEAVISYQRATQMKSGVEGKIKAKFSLGCMYELGEGGLPQDFAHAFELFSYAANRLHQKSQWKVAIFCESGIGVDQFEARAVHYFRLAANSGHREAQLKATDYYMKGKGVGRDLHTAIQILQPAAAAGNKRAKRLLRQAQVRVFLRRLTPFKTQSTPNCSS